MRPGSIVGEQASASIALPAGRCYRELMKSSGRYIEASYGQCRAAYPKAAPDAGAEDSALPAAKTLARRSVVRAAHICGSHEKSKTDSWKGIEPRDMRQRASALVMVIGETGCMPSSTSAREKPQTEGALNTYYIMGPAFTGNREVDGDKTSCGTALMSDKRYA